MMPADVVREFHATRHTDATVRGVYEDALRSTLQFGDFVTVERGHWKLAVVVGESPTSGKIRVCIYSARGDWWTKPRLYPIDEIVPLEIAEPEGHLPAHDRRQRRTYRHARVIAKAKASIARSDGKPLWRTRDTAKTTRPLHPQHTSTWLTRSEVIDILRVSVRMLKNWERSGRLNPCEVVADDRSVGTGFTLRVDALGHQHARIVYDPREVANLLRVSDRRRPRVKDGR